MIKTKIVIIGAGTAGLTALSEARRHTDDIILINDGPYGTTCARVGCMPSKVLLAAAHDFHRRGFLKDAGISGTDKLVPDMPAVMAHVRKLRDRFVSGPVKASDAMDNRSIAGAPRFLDANTIEVNGTRIETELSIIATGTRPMVPEAWKAFGSLLISTDEFFELDDPGKRIAVIGLGPVGAELGQALAQLGAEVHGFSMDPGVAGLTDPEINSFMIKILGEDMTLYIGSPAEIDKADEKTLKVSSAGKSVIVDRVVAAPGRRPNIEGLGLENLDVELDSRGMPVFDERSLQIGDLPVFIAGDVSGLRPVMHEATDEGRIAAYNALNPDAVCLKRRAPMGIVFTTPNAARAGNSYSSLKEKDFVIGKTDFKNQGRAMTEGRAEGLLHVYADLQTGKIIGSEMAVPGGEHIAHILTWAVQNESTVDELLRMPYYHPTFEEGLRAALQNARSQLKIPRSPGDLPLCL